MDVIVDIRRVKNLQYLEFVRCIVPNKQYEILIKEDLEYPYSIALLNHEFYHILLHILYERGDITRALTEADIHNKRLATEILKFLDEFYATAIQNIDTNDDVIAELFNAFISYYNANAIEEALLHAYSIAYIQYLLDIRKCKMNFWAYNMLKRALELIEWWTDYCKWIFIPPNKLRIICHRERSTTS